jgi:hypothetical protein
MGYSRNQIDAHFIQLGVMFGGVAFSAFFILLDRGQRRIGFGRGCDCNSYVLSILLSVY